MYQLIKYPTGELAKGVRRVSDNAFIPFDPANTDYQQFKAQINADEAELQNADGETLSPEEAKAYVATLP